MAERTYSLIQAAKLAIDVQNASNLSGVVRSFADIMPTLWDEADREKKGTDWVNTHPIVLLFVSKIADLSRYTHGSESENFGKAYAECKLLAARVA